MRAHEAQRHAPEQLDENGIGRVLPQAIDRDLAEQLARQPGQGQHHPEADDGGFHPVQHQQLEGIGPEIQDPVGRQQVSPEREQVAHQRCQARDSCDAGSHDDD